MEIVNNMFKSPIKLLLIISLVIFTSILYFERIAPKDFSALFPDSDVNTINSCTIYSIGKETVELDEDDAIKFLRILRDGQYHYNGKKESILIGNLYHVEFLQKNNGSESTILNMVISDENIVYVGNKQYRIKSELNNIINFLYSLY